MSATEQIIPTMNDVNNQDGRRFLAMMLGSDSQTLQSNVRLAILVALGLSPSQATDALLVAAGDLQGNP